MQGSEIVEFTLAAAVGQEDAQATQVLIEITNQSSQPPRYLDEVKVRYYFSIAELLENGQTINDLDIRIDYDEMKSNSDGEYYVTYEIEQYNDQGDCYIEFTWSDYQFYGDLQFQFALMAPVQNSEYVFVWDPTNDYSRSDLQTADELGVPLNEAPTYYEKITMYVDGEQVWGEAPADAPDADLKASYGDVNCDGAVAINDAILLNRLLAEDADVTVSAQGLLNADCNASGAPDSDDSVMILSYLAGFIDVSMLGKAS